MWGNNAIKCAEGKLLAETYSEPEQRKISLQQLLVILDRYEIERFREEDLYLDYIMDIAFLEKVRECRC